MRTTTLLTLLLGASASTAAWGHAQIRVTNNFRDIGALQATLNNLASGNIDIDDIASGPNGEWIIVAGTAIYRSTGVPAAMVTQISSYLQSGRRVDAIAIAPNGSWVVAADDLFARGPSVPQGLLLTDVVKARQNGGRQIDEIVFTPGGGFVVLSEGYYYGNTVPSNLWAAVRDSDKSKRAARRISIGTDGRWIVLAEQWFASEGLSSTQLSHARAWQRNEWNLDHVVLGVGSDFIYFSQSGAVKPALPMRAMEYGLTDAMGNTKNIWERMNELGVPGISVAVVDGGEVRWARGYGDLDGNSGRFVRASSPYSIASMSKYLTALGAMRLVEDGDLALTNDARIMADQGFTLLDTWRDQGPARYGSALPFGVTLRRLLSHTAAMRDNNANDGWGGMLGSVEVATSWILAGYGCDGGCAFGNKTVWVDPAFGAPATATMNYSNAGYEVIRAMMESVRGQSFADIMQAEVFNPLGMTNTTYDIMDPAWNSRSAPGLDGNKNALPRQTYQWYAGGGVYATPEDYAKAMTVLLDLDGTHASGFLSSISTSDILRDQRAGDGPVYGFGINLSAAQVTDTNGERFVHGGFIPAYSWTRMVGVPQSGDGVVIMTNDTSLEGRRLVCEIENAFRAEAGVALNGC